MGKQEGGKNQGFRINRYILLYINQINNKVLQYSTGNYVQYLVITYNGKESKKEPIYIKLNHSAVYLTHCKSTILQQYNSQTKKKQTNQEQRLSLEATPIYTPWSPLPLLESFLQRLAYPQTLPLLLPCSLQPSPDSFHPH